MDELATMLLTYQRSYYIEGRSLISDQSYDLYYDQLEKLEKKYPDKRRDWSPTQRVGSDLSSEFPEVRHTIPVLSLDKVYSIEELENWCDKIGKLAKTKVVITVEPKIDGVSIVCYYKQGQLTHAVTRGNGHVGNDVTPNVRTIVRVPLKLDEPVNLAVRGEIFLPKKRFEEINRGLEEPYANPRNLAAGSIRRIKSSEVAKIPLQVYFYEASIMEESLLPKSHRQVLALLHRWGFPLNPDLGIFALTDSLDVDERPLKDLPAFVQKHVAQRASLDWEIDGLVLKVDDLALRETLGFTLHHPRWALAYKFESPQGQTTIEEIFVQVGRTGRITPVARVHPVIVGGSQITFVTLHNVGFIQALELGIGDLVCLSRRGDVIPAVETVIEKLSEHTWTFPSFCPSCGKSLIQEGAHTFCRNSDCPQQIRERLVFFTGKGQMDMENLGPQTIDVLLENTLVHDVNDLFYCDFRQLLGIAGFGEKKVALIEQGIAKARSKPYSTVLTSLGIPELGKKTVQRLLEQYHNFDTLVDVLQNTPEKLLSIEGIGEKTLQALIKTLLDPIFQKRVEKLKAAGLSFEVESQPSQSDRLQGTVWCITGSFQNYTHRSLIEDKITLHGGRLTSTVTNKTTHLLAGSGGGSKLDKAMILGIKILSEEEFLKLLQ